jgi:hypothetical protein
MEDNNLDSDFNNKMMQIKEHVEIFNWIVIPTSSDPGDCIQHERYCSHACVNAENSVLRRAAAEDRYMLFKHPIKRLYNKFIGLFK